MLYLDHQASTTLHPHAAAAMSASLLEHIANPHSSDHSLGWIAADAVEAARVGIGATIGADAGEIIFTSGATEANNLALLGLAERAGERRRIVVSALEHKAVLGPAHALARQGFEVVVAPAERSGVVELSALEQLVDESTLLVAVMLANNEIGTVQPVAAVAALAKSRGALVHVDAAQALAWLPIDVHTLGADLMSLSSHKIGGPKGIGALFVARHARDRLNPVSYGGEQEDGLRPGTTPTPLCVGFAAACAALPTVDDVFAWRERTRSFEAKLKSLVAGANINGETAERHPGSTSLTLPGIDADLLIAALQPGLAIARGSACTSGIPEPSHVLRAIGLSGTACEQTIRISSGRFTSTAELEEAVSLLRGAVARLQSVEQTA